MNTRPATSEHRASSRVAWGASQVLAPQYLRSQAAASRPNPLPCQGADGGGSVRQGGQRMDRLRRLRRQHRRSEVVHDPRGSRALVRDPLPGEGMGRVKHSVEARIRRHGHQVLLAFDWRSGPGRVLRHRHRNGAFQSRDPCFRLPREPPVESTSARNGLLLSGLGRPRRRSCARDLLWRLCLAVQRLDSHRCAVPLISRQPPWPLWHRTPQSHRRAR